MAKRGVVIGLLVVGALGGLTLGACGDGGTDRDKNVCASCELRVDQDCFDECHELCVADDPNCKPRCTAQCDKCQRDLVCGACVGNCTGSVQRCAPTNETVQCDDGTFGGRFPEPPA